MPRDAFKFSETKRAEYLRLIAEEGLGRIAAAKKVGVHSGTVDFYIRSHPEFATERDRAEMERSEVVEDALFKAAREGNVVACQVWLYNRLPDRWRDKRSVVHTTPPGQPFEVTDARDKLAEIVVSEAERITSKAAG